MVVVGKDDGDDGVWCEGALLTRDKVVWEVSRAVLRDS